MSTSIPSVPAHELKVRIAKLQEVLGKKEVDGALILEKTDLYYFSGTSQQGYLYIPVEGEPLLMVFKEYERAVQESALDTIVGIGSPKKIVTVLADFDIGYPTRLGMELDVVPANLFFQFSSIFKESEIEDVSTDIRLIRGVKSEYEIGKMREAAKLSDAVFAKVAEFLYVGQTEVELAGKLEGYARSLGHQGMIRMRMFNNELYYGHLMSGSDAAVPSYLQSPTGGRGVSSVIGQGAGYKKIEADEPVLVDYVFALDGYLIDQARIFCIGKLPNHLQEAHTAMLEIQEEVKERATPGTVTGELYGEMVALARKSGFEQYFMGVGEKRIRFTGHGVGLELDEFPFIAKGQKLQLESGMVFALEPKVIFPSIGVVGIENTHLLTENGLQQLTQFSDQITNV